MNTPRWKAAPNNRGQGGPAQRGEESSAALGLSEHRHASGRGGGVRCGVPHRPCSEAVWLYTFKLNQVCPMPATFTGRHWAVSGDLQGQVTAGQDPGRQTLHDAGPRPPQRLHQPQTDKGRKAFLQTRYPVERKQRRRRNQRDARVIKTNREDKAFEITEEI